MKKISREFVNTHTEIKRPSPEWFMLLSNFSIIPAHACQ
jgi:hypothetical protein